ncbi:MAG TPA: tripartite tricarboxylate transporter substrate binding protein [Burkholderiales bacterium]|nr:tripartite tricarboxylate transporter substrate binding protein [Burkholderiales bacterium]
MKKLVFVILLAIAPLAVAQTKPVRIVVPYPPGGANDIVARALQPALAASLGQPVVIENRGGGATQLGTEAVARAAPDGATFLLTNIALGANPSLFARLPYDTAKDLLPITLISTVPLVLVVHPSVAANTTAEFIALAKAKAGSVNYASAGNGSANHLAMEMFRASAGIDVVHVPYKGFGPAMTDLLGGQVTSAFATTLAALPHVRAGKLRALGVSTAKRSAAALDVPTIAESGLPGFDVSEWQMLLAPAGTPSAVIDRMQREVARALRQDDVKTRMTELGANPVGSTSQEAGMFLRSELARWADVAKRVGIKPQD